MEINSNYSSILLQNSLGSNQDKELASLLAGTDPSKAKKIQEVSEKFEAVFLNEMIGHLFKTTEVDPVFGGGFSEEIYQSLLIDKYTESFSKMGKFGVSGTVARELLKLQEG